MEYSYIKIKFGDHPLHLSDGRGLYYVSEEVLQSDTLKNAIFTSIGKLFGPAALTAAFYDSFTVSTAFPYLDTTLFFPRPLANLGVLGLTEKAEKKIQYLSKPVFEKWINGETLATGMYTLAEASIVAEDRGLEEKTLLSKQAQDRVSLQKKIAQPYFIEQLRMEENAGLYFLVAWKDSQDVKHQTQFKQALHLLADEGIGSDKTYGFGRFDLVKNGTEVLHSLQLKIPSEASYQMNIGLYRPSAAEQIRLEQDLPNSAYKIIERGGYIAVPEQAKHRSFRKHSAYFFQVGSVFPQLLNRKGEKINLQPAGVNHPVWREGTSIFIPIHKKYVEETA